MSQGKTKACNGPLHQGARVWVGRFGLNRSRKDGMASWCKSCERQRDRARKAPERTGRPFKKPRVWA